MIKDSMLRLVMESISLPRSFLRDYRYSVFDQMKLIEGLFQEILNKHLSGLPFESEFSFRFGLKYGERVEILVHPNLRLKVSQ